MLLPDQLLQAICRERTTFRGGHRPLTGIEFKSERYNIRFSFESPEGLNFRKAKYTIIRTSQMKNDRFFNRRAF